MITRILKYIWRTTKTFRLELLLLPPMLLFFGIVLPSVFIFPFTIIVVTPVCLGLYLIEKKDAFTLFLALPVKRSQLVSAKYALSLILLVGSLLLCVIIMPLANLVKTGEWNTYFELILPAVMMSFLLYSSLNLLYYPISLRIGVVSSITFFYIILTPIMVLGAVFGYALMAFEDGIIKFFAYATEKPLLVNGTMFALAVLIFCISYALSVKIYERRDF